MTCLAHEWLIHTNCSITHDLLQHMDSTWLIDIYELEHHSQLVQHMIAESWIASPIDIYEQFRYIWTISKWIMAESWLTPIIWLLIYLISFPCFDRSNNRLLHSLFKEYETWNRNFPTNNIELKSPPARPLGLNLFDKIFPECFVRFQEAEKKGYKARIQPRNRMDSLARSLAFSFHEPCNFMTVLYLFISDSVPSDS